MTTVNAARDGHIPIGAVTFAPEKNKPMQYEDVEEHKKVHHKFATMCREELQAKQESFPTGAVRDSRKGKGRYDLLPREAIARYAEVMESGMDKYGERNWEQGMPVARCLDSAMRHLFQYLAGFTNEDHLGQCLWNIGAAITIEERAERGVLPRELLLESRAPYVGHPNE